MKWSSAPAFVAALAPLASAFPYKLIEKYQSDPALRRYVDGLVSEEKRQQGADSATAVFETVPTFDADLQYIDVSEGSGYEWVAPGPGDLRGPCPGLNAFANHGFLPHNGYATISQYINVTMDVVGMGLDLSTFLAVLGALIDSGDLQAWSMGGTPGPGIGGPTSSLGHGLIGSHNKYENDVSPTRPDLYESGNNYITQASQFQDLINANPGGFVTLDGLAEYRSQRFDTQVANNPYFFNAPFPGLLVQPAAFTFIYRFMANHTAENPIGELSYETIQSWFGIQGTNGAYTAQQGYERIPANWYRRSLTAPYSIPYFLGDVLAFAALHPKFLDIGGNVNGQPGTFTGVDVANLTGGLFNSASLLQGNNLGCFAFQVVTQVQADLILGPVLDLVEQAVGSVVKELSCPQLENFDDTPLTAFAGYNKAPEFRRVRRNGESY